MSGQESGGAGLTGRDSELQALTDAFVAGHSVVCLTGAGGVGKTRLALEFSRRSRASCWVDLSEAEEESMLVERLAGALELPDDSSEGISPRVALALSRRGSMLIVLDNFEQLIPTALPRLEALVAQAPEVAWLITSRQRLGLAEEKVIELVGLSLPSARGPMDNSRLLESSAVQFLQQRARLLGVEFKPAELPFVAQLVSELGGSPLAIELAASRLRLLNVRALLHRVRSHPDVLSRAEGTAGARSLRAAFERSWIALDQAQQQALAALTVFRGGFELGAAEAVLAGCDPGNAGLEVVQGLRDRSLVSLAPGEGRLMLAPTLRAFSEEQLSEPIRERAEGAHGAFFLEAGEAARREADSGKVEAHGWLAAERYNVLAIVERLQTRTHLSAKQAERALRALLILAPGRGPAPPAWGYLRVIDPAVSASVGSGASPRLVARGLLLRGEALWQHQRLPSALADLIRASDMARALNDLELEAHAGSALAGTLVDRAASGRDPMTGEHTALARSSLEDAARLYERSERIHMEQGQPAAAARGALGVAVVKASGGESDRARTLIERAGLRLERAGDSWSAVDAICHLAQLELDLGHHDASHRALQRAGLLIEATGDRVQRVRREHLVARLDVDRGELDGAAGRLERCADEFGVLGLGHASAVALGDAGVAAHASGELARAHVLLSDALAQLGDQAVRERRRLSAHLQLFEAPEDDLPAATRGAVERFSARNAAVRAWLRCAGLAAGAPPGRHVLLVGEGGLWFRAPHRERVSLERRRPLARLLWCLGQARVQGAGGVDRDGLIGAGWPDERILAAPAAHRVRVAISTLRKLGLGEVLVTTENGYALTAEIPIQIA